MIVQSGFFNNHSFREYLNVAFLIDRSFLNYVEKNQNVKENRSKFISSKMLMKRKVHIALIYIFIRGKMKKKSLKYRLFKAFLQHTEYGPMEMAAHLDANYNSVKVIYAQLCKNGFLKRERRGRYCPQVPRILFDLYSKIEKLEKR